MTVRVLCCSLGVAVLAIAGAAQAAPGPVAATLRLGDLERGYQVGDDSGCSGLGVEGAAPAFAELVARERPSFCYAQLERLWPSSRGTVASPPLVESVALSFRTAAGAGEALARAPEVLAGVLGVEMRVGASGGRKIGAEARLLSAERMLVFGRDAPGVGVAWRSGAVMAFVVLGGTSGAAAQARALELAERQQQRIVAGGPAQAPDRSADVALDDPRIAVPVYWLGASMDPPGRLPRLRLFDSFAVLGGGPGNEVHLDYLVGRSPGLTLDLWKPKAFERFRRTRLGRLVWSDPCAKRWTMSLARGRAEIIAGYMTPSGGACTTRRPDRYLVHLFLPGVVAVVNMPYCFSCTIRQRDRYGSMAGVAAIVRALRQRR